MKHILLIICILVQIQVFGKPIRIIVSDLLGSAKYIDEVVITNYDGKGKIYFQSLKYKDTINNASCGRLIKNGWNFPYKKQNNYWTENQPFIGDKVLIVIDRNDRVKVYGKKVNMDYRLWSPLISGSIAMFDFEKPLKPIDKSKLLENSNPNKNMTCWDGCLIPIDQLNLFIKKYRSEFAKKINAINLKKFKGNPVYSVFYNDTLNYFINSTWTDEPPGKLYSLILTYNNGKSIEIIPIVDNEHPKQFNENNKFDFDKFKQMKIKEIKFTK